MQEKIEATLKKLVAIPSVSNDPAACREVIEFVRSEFEPLGLHIASDMDAKNPWLIATTQPTKTPTTLLAAHLDVVPGTPDVFMMRKEDGKLYGRGTYDMKFAAACYIEFAKAHADILPTLDIGFLFTTDEEIGGASVLRILDDGWRAGRVFIPDGGENWKIEKRAKGFYGIQLTATGRTAHGSRPWEGDNAVQTLMNILTTLRQEYPEKDKTDATLAITGFSGGTAVNQIPSDATALLDFRSFDADELTTFYARITGLAAERGVIITVPQSGAPVAFDETSPAVQDFLQALRDIRGTDPEYADSFGGTDARHFAKFGIPTIITEPRGGNRHAPDEWIMAEDLEPYYQLIARWLCK